MCRVKYQMLDEKGKKIVWSCGEASFGNDYCYYHNKTRKGLIYLKDTRFYEGDFINECQIAYLERNN